MDVHHIDFIKSDSPYKGETELIQLISTELAAGKKLLWMVSGGSNVKIVVRIMDALEDELTKNLQLILSDERFGPVNHPDSNYFQLMQAGLKLKQATFEPVLSSDLDLSQTIIHYQDLFKSKSSSADLIIGQLGIGGDGHIAGILPDSPVVNSNDDVVYYEVGEYKRLSLSLNSLKLIDMARIFCFGQNKYQALIRLKQGTDSLSQLPSLILNNIRDVKVYNDQLGD